MILLKVERMWSTVILLPLHPASLTHKNHPQRHTKIHGVRPLGRKDRWCFCKISCSCHFCHCSCGCCLKTHISFSLRCALQKNVFLYVWSHKGPSIFNLGLLVFELGLNGNSFSLSTKQNIVSIDWAINLKPNHRFYWMSFTREASFTPCLFGLIYIQQSVLMSASPTL